MIPAQRFDLHELPVVELGAVAQAEAGQEVIAVERRGFDQEWQARGAGIGRGMAVLPAGGQTRAELSHVHPEVRAGNQGNRLPISSQVFFAQGGAQRGERAPQGRPCVLVVVLGPKQAGQRFARVAAPADRQISQQRGRLACVYGNRRIVACDARCAQEADGELGHGFLSARNGVLPLRNRAFRRFVALRT